MTGIASDRVYLMAAEAEEAAPAETIVAATRLRHLFILALLGFKADVRQGSF